MDLLTVLRNTFAIEGEGKWLGGSAKKQIDNLYLFSIVLAVVVIYFFVQSSVFMDDVFIYFRVAKHIANGTGPVLNPGDSHFAVTSPLWVYMLAFCYKISGFSDLVMVSKVLSTLLLAMASLWAFLSLRRTMGSWAVLTPLPVFFNFITVTTIGGEIPLVYCSLFGVLWAYYIKRDFRLTGFLAAVAYLARAELILLLPVLALHYVIVWQKEKKSFGQMAGDWGKLALVFLLLVSIWHIYYGIHFHTLFPNTLKTKIIQGKSGMWQLYYTMGRPLTLEMFHGMKFLVFPLLLGLMYCRAISLTLLGYTILHFYAYKWIITPYYHWYFYDFFIIIPMFTMFGMIAFFVWLNKWRAVTGLEGKRKFMFPGAFKIAGILLIIFLVGFLVTTTTKIHVFHTFKNDGRLMSYKKIADSIRPMVKKGDVLLVPEIGIVGYYLEDAVIRDLCGIASTDVTLENINNLDYFVFAYAPRFIFFAYSMNQKSPQRSFIDKNWNPVLYQLAYPHGDISNPVDCIFARK